MSPSFLIERFHTDGEVCAAAFDDEAAGRRAVADALFTVAVAHKMRAEGAEAFRIELERLLATIDPIADGEQAPETDVPPHLH